MATGREVSTPPGNRLLTAKTLTVYGLATVATGGNRVNKTLTELLLHPLSRQHHPPYSQILLEKVLPGVTGGDILTG